MGCRRVVLIAVSGLLACGKVDDEAPAPDEPAAASGGEGGEAAAPVGGETSTGGRDASSGGRDASTGGASTGGIAPSEALVIADCEEPSADDASVHDGHVEVAELDLDTAWGTFSDAPDAVAAGKTPGTLEPDEGGPFACVEQDRDGESSWVFNARGSGFNVWGAGMILLLNPEAPDGVDLSSYSALRFWAKVDSATSPKLRLALATEQTNALDFDGTCDPALGACGNHFGYNLTVAVGEWRQYTVWFDQLRQETWSSQMFPAAAFYAATGIVFQVGTGDFDYSIDDVELVP